MILPLLRLGVTVALAAGAVLILRKLGAKPTNETPLPPAPLRPEEQ